MATRRWLAVMALLSAVASACGDDEHGSDAVRVATPTVLATTPTPEPTITPVCGDGRFEFGLRCEALTFCRGGCVFGGDGTLCIDVPCGNDCVCPSPACGDGVLDFGEECEAPGFATCRVPDGFGGLTWATCAPDCRCPSTP